LHIQQKSLFFMRGMKVNPRAKKRYSWKESESPLEEVIPAGGRRIPVEGKRIPAEGRRIPAEGKRIPAEERRIPAEGERIPAE